MPEKIEVPADLEELCAAFEDSSMDNRYYLDLETGEVIFISDSYMDAEEKEELDETIDEWLGERYIWIPRMSSDEGYEDMEDFIETVEDENLKEKLCIAINGRRAFRRFKDVLLRYPDERERWFKFQNARVIKRVREWLEDEGIEIVKPKPIEIKEISTRELCGSNEIEESWKGFGPRACMNCGSEDELNERYFIISRCPASREEEEWLETTMEKQYGVKEYGIAAGVFGDNRGLIESAVCGRCGSYSVFFDF